MAPSCLALQHHQAAYVCLICRYLCQMVVYAASQHPVFCIQPTTVPPKQGTMKQRVCQMWGAPAMHGHQGHLLGQVPTVTREKSKHLHYLFGLSNATELSTRHKYLVCSAFKSRSFVMYEIGYWLSDFCSYWNMSSHFGVGEKIFYKVSKKKKKKNQIIAETKSSVSTQDLEPNLSITNALNPFYASKPLGNVLVRGHDATWHPKRFP